MTTKYMMTKASWMFQTCCKCRRWIGCPLTSWCWNAARITLPLFSLLGSISQLHGVQSILQQSCMVGASIFIISGSKFFKIAKVVPIFKAESGILSSDYRPVSLLSNIGKIIEKLMYKRPNVFLEKKHLLWFSISV